MIGGLLKTTSHVAIAAAAVAIAGAFTPAKAADLGGNCCADLEERVAELEATTVRKGNRKVSVQLSGYVSHHVMYWDDGIRSDTYIGDGGNYGSRFRFRGDAKISPTLSAGFLYEFTAFANSISSVNQGNGGDDLGASGGGSGTGGTPGNIAMRDSTVWLRHSQLGMVKVGHGSTATDNLVLIDLGGMSGASTPDVGLYGGGMRIAQGGGAGYTNGTWQQAFTGGLESWDSTRRNHVLYETPTLHGFSIQAAFAEDNFWDVALRYAGEHHGLRLAFGIGYREDTEFNAPVGAASITNAVPGGINCATIAGVPGNCERKHEDLFFSASVLHVKSGLFLTGAAGWREVSGDAGTSFVPPDQDFWYIAGGLRRNWFGYGDTVLFAEYSEHNDFLPAAFATVSSSQVTHWGIGVTQYIDAAAMELFTVYKNYSLDAVENGLAVNTKDLDLIISGVRVSF